VATPPLNPLVTTLRRIADDLRAAGREWALIGGLAIGARAEPRTTRDIDLAVGVESDGEAEALVFALQALGYSAIAAIEQEAVGRLSTVRLLPPGGRRSGVVIDLLFASSGIEPEVVRAAEKLEIVAGLMAPVARTGHLMALKVLARDDRSRPQDLDDFRALLAEASSEDLADARAALRLIEARGFHRGRRLSEDFERLLVAPPQ
jgi:predicted nucleotidyltransferase